MNAGASAWWGRGDGRGEGGAGVQGRVNAGQREGGRGLEEWLRRDLGFAEVSLHPGVFKAIPGTHPRPVQRRE